MSKKLIFRISIVLGLIIALLVVIPFFFQDRLIADLTKQLNKSINAKITYKKVNISLLKDFPNATLSVEDIAVTNLAPFKGDTLFFAKNIDIAIKLTDLFKSVNEKITIKKIDFNNAKVSLKVNKAGIDNYSIAKKSSTLNKDKSKSPSKLTLDVSKYSITNSSFFYRNDKSDINIKLTNFNHQGSGNFSTSKMVLITTSQAKSFSFTMQKIPYFEDVKINLEAVFDIDLDKMRFTFKKNSTKINAVNIVFGGAIQLADTYQYYNLTFKSADDDFKNILSLIPSIYKNNFSDIKAIGKVDFSGNLIGKLTETEIPKFDISIKTKNASFKYLTLPKAISNIYFDGKIANKTGNINDVFLNIKESKFTIDKDIFSANGNIMHIATNPSLNINLRGNINLKNLSEAYPIEAGSDIKGILKTDISIVADRKSIETKQYQNIKNNGEISLNGFSYSSKSFANPIFINTLKLNFNTNIISLTSFKAHSGLSDIAATGTLNNFYGFLFGKKELRGNFKINADKFVVNDFLSNQKTTSNTKVLKDSTTQETLKIPKLLNIKATVKSTTVFYDNLILKNVNGQLLIKDGKASFFNTTANTLGGLLTVNGAVNTVQTPTDFDMSLNVKNFNIQQSFKAMETFQYLAPIAKAMQGKINSNFTVKGNLP